MSQANELDELVIGTCDADYVGFVLDFPEEVRLTLRAGGVVVSIAPHHAESVAKYLENCATYLRRELVLQRQLEASSAMRKRRDAFREWVFWSHRYPEAPVATT